MTDRFHQRPQDVQAIHDPGYAGQPLHGANGGSQLIDAINASPSVAHRVRLTFAPLAGSESFGWTTTKDGESVAFSFAASSGANTAAEVGAEAKIAIEADEVLPQVYHVVDNGNGTIDLVAYSAEADGQFTLSSLTGHVTQSTVATGADATAIPFGRAVVEITDYDPAGAFTASQRRGLADQFCALPSSTTLPAQARRFVFGGTYSTDEQVFALGTIEVDGQSHLIFCSGSGANEDAMGTALAADINANHGSYLTATYTGASNRLDVVSDLPGLVFTMVVRPASNASTCTVTTTVQAGEHSDINEKLLGVAKYTVDEQTTTLGTYATEYAPKSGVKIVSKGAVYVEVAGGTVTAGGTVYIGTGSGSEGKFYAASGSGRVPVSRARARWRAARGSIGIIDLF